MCASSFHGKNVRHYLSALLFMMSTRLLNKIFSARSIYSVLYQPLGYIIVSTPAIFMIDQVVIQWPAGRDPRLAKPCHQHLSCYRRTMYSVPTPVCRPPSHCNSEFIHYHLCVHLHPVYELDSECRYVHVRCRRRFQCIHGHQYTLNSSHYLTLTNTNIRMCYLVDHVV